MSSAVERDMLRNARFQTPLAQGEVVPCGVFQPGEDPLIGFAALAHVAHSLVGDVEVFQPFGLFLPEDDARVAVELLYLGPRQFVDVAPAHAGQARKEECVFQYGIWTLRFGEALQLVESQVFAVYVLDVCGFDRHGGRVGDDAVLDRLVQRGFEFEEIAALAVCRKSGIAFGLGLLRQIGFESLDELFVDHLERRIRSGVGDEVFQCAVPVAPVPRRLLALFYQSLDVFDEVGANFIFYGEAILLVLLGEQPFGFDLLGHFEVDLVVVALQLVFRVGIEVVFEGLEFTAMLDAPFIVAGVPVIVFQHQRGLARRTLRFLPNLNFHAVEVLGSIFCRFSRLGIARTAFGSALGLSKTFRAKIEKFLYTFLHLNCCVL